MPPPDPHACYPHQGNAVEPRAWQVKAGEDTVVKLLMSATAKKVKRPWWEHQTTQLIVDGAIRRGHLMALISPETLKRVGFAAQELLDAAFGLAELREGGYLAKELRLIGLKAAELGQAGYTPAELNAGGYTAKDLKQAEFSASEMKSGGCTADASPRPSSLRAPARYVHLPPPYLRLRSVPAFSAWPACSPLAIIPPPPWQSDKGTARYGRYTAKQLKDVAFSAAELKTHGFSATELREGTFTAGDLKPLGYSAADLKKAGFEATEVSRPS